jgi:hypothetical protein
MPILHVAPADVLDKTKKLQADAGPNVHPVAPEEVEDVSENIFENVAAAIQNIL